MKMDDVILYVICILVTTGVVAKWGPKKLSGFITFIICMVVFSPVFGVIIWLLLKGFIKFFDIAIDGDYWRDHPGGWHP